MSQSSLNKGMSSKLVDVHMLCDMVYHLIVATTVIGKPKPILSLDVESRLANSLNLWLKHDKAEEGLSFNETALSHPLYPNTCGVRAVKFNFKSPNIKSPAFLKLFISWGVRKAGLRAMQTPAGPFQKKIKLDRHYTTNKSPKSWFLS